MDRNWTHAAEKLPKEPSAERYEEVWQEVFNGDLLGEDLILYQRESAKPASEWERLMTPEKSERMRRRGWRAACICLSCGERFEAEWIPGGIRVEDGEGMQEYTDDAWATCPCCGNDGRLTRRSALKNGRTYQVLKAETMNVDEYTTVLYWMAARRQNAAGGDYVSLRPHAALLIDREGKLRRFRAHRLSGEVRDVEWLPCARSADPMQQAYPSCDAVNGRMTGGLTWKQVPVLSGHTGEKSALEEYLRCGGTWIGHTCTCGRSIRRWKT